MKKFKYSFVLALLLSVVASIVSAQNTTNKIQVDSIYYRILTYAKDNRVSIAYGIKDLNGMYRSPYKGDIVIPEYVEYDNVKYKVVEIDEGAFANCKDLTSIRLPQNINAIGAKAFANCPNLTSFEFPDSVKLIADCVFAVCTKLKTVKFNKIIAGIPYGTFLSCSSLEEVVIPENTENDDYYELFHIGEKAFSGCKSIVNINLSDRVTHIDKNAFERCKGLMEITFGRGVIYVDDNAFIGCDSLSEEKIQNNKRTVDENKTKNSPADFNGNISAFVNQNIKYPEICQEQNIQGRVTVQFIVEQDGTITGARVLRSPDEHLSAEALRMVNSMPKWKPAIKFGKAVKMLMTIPVMFRLS